MRLCSPITVQPQRPPSRPDDDPRRRVRAPYRVAARLEIIGVSKPGQGWWVNTIDANEWGVRVASPHNLPSAEVLLEIRIPNRSMVKVTGRVIHTRLLREDEWVAGIEFSEPQPLLSAAQIDSVNYGS